MALADYLAGLNRRLGLASLGEQGLTTADFPDLIAGGRGNSMKTNPVVLSDDELWTILEESL